MNKINSKFRCSSTLIVVFWHFCLLCLAQRSQAQAQATTDPIEVKALNTIFQKWNKRAAPTWNTTGDPCSGTAVDSRTVDEQDIIPAIKCNCTFNAGTTCHITQLKLKRFNVEGIIPEELQNLTYLYILNLGENSLQGHLPSFIGNLVNMQYLTLDHNVFNGTIPKELAKLQNLKSLALGSNFFTGSLPSELGSLVTLEQLYIDSSGVGGVIPLSFSKLTRMKILWASDNSFTGKIPDFIGNWTELNNLKLQGNSFEGPIPSSFSNLISLTELRISDLSKTSSSLAFIKNMKALTTLILRNNMISDTIPSDIEEYTRLVHLDLSFNNITGKIPDSLFTLSLLIFLFLGNNSLSGTLPPQKSNSLINIDLSYNELSGSFPSWVNRDTLQLNMVANNFVMDDSMDSIMPGLRCLQRDFPCNHSCYSTLAIDCGGRGMTSGGIEFEGENETLSMASYHVSNTNRWAVSNTGRFGQTTSNVYTKDVANQITNTSDSLLFQTARISAGSLRYYGLGLENGDYNVTLLFAEISYENSHAWQSRGRRVFDIYLQGNLLVKDFDIKKEAGNVSFSAVEKEFTTQVSKNYLEIHLFWAGKGTCCIPGDNDYGPSISAIKVTAGFTPTLDNCSSSSKKNKTGLVVGIVVAVGVVSFISVFAVIFIRRRRRLDSYEEELLGMGASARPNTFSYAELRTATEDFAPANKLGEGGFGSVYKGTLSDGRIVAVKQLSVISHQGKSQFAAEIATISAVQHRNLVKLYGCCIERDKRLLVYEYLQNKSLDQALFGQSGLHVDWPTRFEICLGTARGLAYLHEESRPRIIHRDIKASNILLDEDLYPKLSDFGLAKLYDDKKTHISTMGVAGTIGYLAPEYAMRGHLTEKADVFGFGVVALEIISGRSNADLSLGPEKIYLLEWAWHLHESNRKLELVDPSLSGFNEEEVVRVLGVALLCIQASPLLRPPMSRVVGMLSGDIEVSIVTSRPGYLTDLDATDMSSFVSIDTSTMSSTTSSQYVSSAQVSIVADRHKLPVNMTVPMLQKDDDEGR